MMSFFETVKQFPDLGPSIAMIIGLMIIQSSVVIAAGITFGMIGFILFAGGILKVIYNGLKG